MYISAITFAVIVVEVYASCFVLRDCGGFMTVIEVSTSTMTSSKATPLLEYTRDRGVTPTLSTVANACMLVSALSRRCGVAK